MNPKLRLPIVDQPSSKNLGLYEGLEIPIPERVSTSANRTTSSTSQKRVRLYQRNTEELLRTSGQKQRYYEWLAEEGEGKAANDNDVAYPFWKRPKTRGDCEKGPRPCPWVSCRYHLFVDAKDGDMDWNFPVSMLDQVGHTCVLDVADRGENTFRYVGTLYKNSRERQRQIEASTLKRLKMALQSHPAGRDLVLGLKTDVPLLGSQGN